MIQPTRSALVEFRPSGSKEWRVLRPMMPEPAAVVADCEGHAPRADQVASIVYCDGTCRQQD